MPNNVRVHALMPHDCKIMPNSARVHVLMVMFFWPCFDCILSNHSNIDCAKISSESLGGPDMIFGAEFGSQCDLQSNANNLEARRLSVNPEQIGLGLQGVHGAPIGLQ